MDLQVDGDYTDSEELQAGDSTYNLDDPAEVSELIERLNNLRQDLRDGKLDSYEGKSTDWGGGGRAELLRDQIVADLALKRAQGKNDLSYEDMMKIAQKKAATVAAVRRSQGKF